MIAVYGAWARTFWRDRPGVALTLLLPALVYLLFAAVFGAGARGELDPVVGLSAPAETAGRAAIAQALETASSRPPQTWTDAADLERAVIEGRVDVGVIVAPGQNGFPRVTVLSASAGGPAASMVGATLQPVAARLANAVPTPPRVALRAVGPQGDMQAVYYAGAVSVMFVFFAAMHGALNGLDERRSGLQARMTLACGGHGRILTGRLAWLATVGVLQSAAVFVAAFNRLPAMSGWQVGAMLATALLSGLAAGGVALALVAFCRSREQAQPLTTFAALLLAALGGSMAPRFLMPEVFRTAGLLTPHAWAIDAYQRILWLQRLDAAVLAAWSVLAAIAMIGALTAYLLERRRAF